jgi:hypothetical protein
MQEGQSARDAGRAERFLRLHAIQERARIEDSPCLLGPRRHLAQDGCLGLGGQRRLDERRGSRTPRQQRPSWNSDIIAGFGAAGLLDNFMAIVAESRSPTGPNVPAQLEYAGDTTA